MTAQQVRNDRNALTVLGIRGGAVNRRLRSWGKAGATRVAILLVTMALVSAACTSSSTKAAPAKFEPGPCPKTAMPVPALATAKCGTLVVPENRSKSNGRTIRLAVAIVPAKSPTPAADPVVYMHGGPGGDYFSGPVADLVSAGVNANHELILMGQRGTYSSQPNLVCPELDAAFTASVPLGYSNPGTRQAVIQGATACHRRLVSQGVDLSAYNTTESATDLADLRTALGIKQWDVFGHSYGTTLALAYLRDHPQGIRSFIVDGQMPPSAVSIAYTWGGPREAFPNLFDACAAQPSCATNFPQLSQTFTRLGQQLEANPARTQVTLDDGSQVSVTLDTGELLGWMNLATHFAADVPAFLQALDHGNPQPIAKQWATSKENHSADVGAFSWGLFDSIWCSEAVPFSTPSQDLQAGQRALPGFPNSVLSAAPTISFFFLRDQCPIWNVPKAPSSSRAVTTSSVPSLILNGGFDAQTAPGNGADVARTLSHAMNLTFPGAAHAVYADSPCAQSVIRSFLDNPNAPDTSCVPTVKPAPFTTGLQPAPASSPNDEPQNEPN